MCKAKIKKYCSRTTKDVPLPRKNKTDTLNNYTYYQISTHIRRSWLRIAGVLIVWMTCQVPLFGQISGAGSSVYHFLSLPVSSRLNALGGDNVAMQDRELTMAMANPALLNAQHHMQLSLNYAYFYQNTMSGCAMYAHTLKEVNHIAAGVHYLDYGTMSYADVAGNLTGGKFAARDVLIDLMYARQLGQLFTVGVALKPVMSFYEQYNSLALAADVGGHFHTRDSLFQLGITLRNIGWQLKGFYSEEGGQVREQLPLNFEIGFSYRFKHAPIRLGMTAHNLQRWDLSYQMTNQPADTKTDVQWYDMLFRHTIFFVDIVPKSDRFYLTFSYNHRRRAEMQLKDQRSIAGLAFGAGVRIKMVRVGFALSQYTKSNLTYQATLGLDINQFK